MALFSRTKKEDAAKDAPKVAEKATKTAQPTDRDLSSVLIRPRMTEKTVQKSGEHVYTFVIRKDATKYDVRDAVQQQFNVTPVKVNIVNKRPRKVLSRARGRVVSKPGLKKAYVYLKSGDSISLV